MKNKIISLLLVGTLGATIVGYTAPQNKASETALEQSENVQILAEAENTSTSEKMFVKNGKTNYKIVYDDAISTTEMLAITEFIDLMYTGTGIIIERVTDSEVSEYNADGAYIAIGNSDYTKSAGVTANYDVVGSNGYHIETKGSSVFIVGGGDWGSVWGVYDFLGDQLGYHCYYEDELYFDSDLCKESVLVNVNKDVRPDWEWRIIGDGEGYNSKSVRTRLRMHENNDVWATSGTISFGHTFFSPYTRNYGFVPIDPCYGQHPNWYNDSLSSLCFTRDPEGLCQQVLSRMIELVETCPGLESINFSQLDNPQWCYCDSCKAQIEKYGGAPSTTQVIFMRRLGNAFKEYMDAHHPDRHVIIYMYSYWITLQPPTFNDSQIDELKMPDNVGIQFCPLSANCKYSMESPQNSLSYGYFEQWKKICSNIAVYDYEEDFGDYVANYDGWNKLQANIDYFYRAGGVVHYNLMAYGNIANSDWSRLHMYLESNLLWETEADVNVLTEDFFKHYYRDASEYMLEWYEAYRVYSLLNGLTNTISQGQCDYYLSLAKKAFDSILKYKYTDPELYTKLYDRINLETITIRYRYIASYRFGIGDSAAVAEYVKAFREDCGYFGIQLQNEGTTIDTWLARLGF